MGEPPEDVVVTTRAHEDADAHPFVPGSTRDVCEQCGHDVWVAPATRASIADGTYPPTIWCMPCIAAEVREDA